MQYLYQWVENLAYYLILMTAVQHILPNDAYRKYIRFFSGLIMVLMLVTPILDLFGVKGALWQMYRSEEAVQMRKMEQQLEVYQKEFEQYLLENGQSKEGMQ